MVDISGGKYSVAEEHIQRLFKTQEINGVTLDIVPGYPNRWGDPENKAWYGIPDGNPKFAVAKAGVNVDDWLQLQKSTFSNSTPGSFRHGADDDTREWVKQCAENGDLGDVPEPVLEIKSYEDYKVDAQEGRSRAMGARDAGIKMIPVWIAARSYR